MKRQIFTGLLVALSTVINAQSLYDPERYVEVLLGEKCRCPSR